MTNQFTMPPEWHKHERTIIEWPVKDSLVWPENHLEVLEAYTEVVKAIAKFEPVTLIANEATYMEAMQACGEVADVIIIPHDDAWVRDNGPTIVLSNEGGRRGISWMFNAWGEKYTPYDKDNAVACQLLGHLKIECLEVPIVMEGGSIHVDGEGTLLTTKECLLNKNRNPKMSQGEIETILKEQLGVSAFIWLDKGLDGDETDGHVDNIACFIEPGIVALQTCYDDSDPNYVITKDNLKVLENVRDAKGRKLKIIELPTPPIRTYKGERLTLSYLNYYVVNGGIILPIFGGDAKTTDEEAIKILTGAYPDREIVTVDGMGLIKEGGNVHCITQQIPCEG